MEAGDSIEITNGSHTKTVTVSEVLRGRVIVHVPHIGECVVDLLGGKLAQLQPPSGVCSVDLATGRIVGTSGRLLLGSVLEELAVGDQVHLDDGSLADVVDALPSEGTVKIYVPPTKRQSGVWLVGWHVASESTLLALRQRAGVVARAS